jgi:predicted DNA-binding transcriptional regulator AlpA
VALSPKLENLVRLTTTHFELLNRNKFLSRSDRKQLKLFFLESILDPHPAQAVGQIGTTEKRNGFMTAKEVEAWLKIDVKTLYRYADLKLIPHLRIQGNVRFRASDLQRWVARHSHIPRGMRAKARAMGSHPTMLASRK